MENKFVWFKDNNGKSQRGLVIESYLKDGNTMYMIQHIDDNDFVSSEVSHVSPDKINTVINKVKLSGDRLMNISL